MELVTLWNARTEGGNDSEFRHPTSGAHGSADRADRLPRGKPLAFGGVRPFCHECKGCSFHGFFVGFDARRFPKGNEGKRVSSGYNRRRGLATRSSGKQQAERTAVRTAPIVCPEESPLVRPQAQSLFPAGFDAPTTAREWDLPSHGALTLFFRWRKKSVQKKASGTATPEAARPASRHGLCPAVALRAVLDLGSLRSPAGKKPFIAHF